MTVSDWRSGLRLQLEDFDDTFVVAGARQKDVFDAIAVELENRRLRTIRDSRSARVKNGSPVCACWIAVINAIAIPDLQHSYTRDFRPLHQLGAVWFAPSDQRR
jgi:hypothetical protein